EIKDELIHHLVPANRARDALDAGIGGPLADEEVRVKNDYACGAVAARGGGGGVGGRFGCPGLLFGGARVVEVNMPDVSIKDRSQVQFLHFLCLLPFL